MSETGHSATGYIIHHLTNLRFDLTQMKFLHGEETGGFGVVHVDTLLFSIGLGALFLWLFIKAAKSATSDVPGGCRISAKSWSSSSTPRSRIASTAAIR